MLLYVSVVIAALLNVVMAQNRLVGTISVENYQVSRTTTFNFDLTLSGLTVASNDYLQVSLPLDLDSKFVETNNPVCSIDGASIQSCLIVDSKTA